MLAGKGICVSIPTPFRAISGELLESMEGELCTACEDNDDLRADFLPFGIKGVDD